MAIVDTAYSEAKHLEVQNDDHMDNQPQMVHNTTDDGKVQVELDAPTVEDKLVDVDNIYEH